MSETVNRVLPIHSPPAFLKDLSTENQTEWSKQISAWMKAEIYGNPKLPLTQFFDGTVTPFDVTQKPVTISWTAFPNLVNKDYPDDNQRWKYADEHRDRQDEYCEWSVQRDEDGNIVQVTFTCEGPEYWEFIAKYQKDTLLKLYTDLNPNAGPIQDDELFTPGKDGELVYNRKNKYNNNSNTGNIAHLIQRANTLQAEVDIVAQATVVRQKNGKVIDNQDELIRCSQFGDPGRNSDPLIGFKVNSAIREGNAISIADPLALYMKSFDSSAFTLGREPIADIPGVIRWTRGDIAHNMGLRLTISIPEDYKQKTGRNWTVSDIEHDTKGNVKYGAQFADYIKIGVGAVFIPNVDVAPAHPCKGEINSASRSLVSSVKTSESIGRQTRLAV